MCPRPNCGMGIIPPSANDEECRKIQCIGGCGVSDFLHKSCFFLILLYSVIADCIVSCAFLNYNFLYRLGLNLVLKKTFTGYYIYIYMYTVLLCNSQYI